MSKPPKPQDQVEHQLSAISYSLSIFNSHRLMVVVIAGTMVLAGLFDGLILSLIALVIEILSNDGTVREDSNIGWAVRIVGLFGVEVTVVSTILIALIGMGIRAGLIYSHHWLVGRERGKYEASLKYDMFSASMLANWTYLIGSRSGDLVNTISVEGRRAGSAFQSMLISVAAALNVGTYLVVALFVMWQATLLAIIPVGLTLLLFRFASTRAHKLGRGATEANSELTSSVSEAFSSSKFIKGSALETQTIARVSNPISTLAEIDEKSGINNGFVQAGYEFIVLAVLLVGLGVTSQFVDLQSGTVTLFVLLFVRAYQRARGWQQSYQTLNHHVPSVDRVTNVLTSATNYRESTPNALAPVFSNELALDEVAFSYGDNRNVLDGLSLSIPAGSMTSIVGPSGTGKTTLIDVVMGLLKPDAGEFLIDGVSLSTVDPYSWRKQIGYVTQDVNLFHDTIERNISWGSESVDVERVEWVSELCGASKFISDLPDGYSTVIGDRGLRISGGQRQRIAMARAFYRDPKLLILDEATSELDSESEEQIQKTIESIRGQITILTVAHRLRTVMSSDTIHVLNNGKVVESGSPSELMAMKSIFYNMRQEDS
ncbi:ABC transporter ATP-binding protein [Candidatus Lucifugimonas marina]|uniref:ATP-binding cassette domain-containing protein n=1 Tax=Candidatus Lucifugimonas marina TaxID=3038979 RepID=A0AAJ5ZIQ0_9CHLR|nr:ATP-binding cassette domain-containing protein [SAR202 cluster bacterium JH702]MDG0868273.1 ATP-binding cassette domain-containing protein [SAR202 cluster bacterium JH639]WFG34917.1 ATP-binding cassette domain-containing protein [SAR202 cluster bacterium JH545]WFG38868.1 ATP-binding cassette domain-containing protein [SAR202 cluster bacterium JH1073]